MTELSADIVIIGGGIMGSATAYFLAASGEAGSITVIEPDPSYARATTPAGAGGVRRLMSRPENIRMSAFSLRFYAGFAETMRLPGEAAADIAFRRRGYLFLVGKEGVEQMRANFRTQRAEGAPVELLEPAALKARFPSIDCRQVALACHAPEDAWIDPYAALLGFRKKAQSLGVTYLEDRVEALESAGRAVTTAQLRSGRAIKGEVFVNTAGPWAGEIATMLNAALPVQPLCRVQYFWLCQAELEPLPLIKNESGLFLRPEGQGFVGGCPSWEIEPGFIWDIDRGYFANYFEERVWPLLAAAVPKFEAVKLQRSWAGHYSQNIFDGNMILGRFSPGHENIFTACGFSGHGIMHAPAVGRALSELVLKGRFESLDLSRLGFQRVIDNAPYPELGIR